MIAHLLALACGLAAAVCMVFAVVGMVTGRSGERTGWALRVAALICFGAAIVLGAAGR